MRRSERKRRSPARYSPLLADSKLNPPLKLEVIARYMSISVKRDSAANEGSVKAIAYVSEQSLENPPSSDRSFEVLSKYSKPGEPSILEIFGESPYIMKLGGNSKGDEIDVTGDEGPSTSKEPPSWIESGPLEGTGAPKPHKPIISSVERFAMPDMGFADLISESADLPQSGFPMDGCAEVEGASHPDNRSGSKGLAPQKKKLIQQHLILLLHAYKCERVALTKVPCPVPYCSVMKKVQAHMRICIDGYNCAAPFCSSSRRIMCHWKHCKTPDCVVCSRLKCLAMHKRKKELEKIKAMGVIAPPEASHAQGPAVVKLPSPQDAAMSNAA